MNLLKSQLPPNTEEPNEAKPKVRMVTRIGAGFVAVCGLVGSLGLVAYEINNKTWGTELGLLLYIVPAVFFFGWLAIKGRVFAGPKLSDRQKVMWYSAQALVFLYIALSSFELLPPYQKDPLGAYLGSYLVFNAVANLLRMKKR